METDRNKAAKGGSSSSVLLAAREALIHERKQLGCELEQACISVLKRFEARTGFRPNFATVTVHQWGEGEDPKPTHSIEMVGRC